MYRTIFAMGGLCATLTATHALAQSIYPGALLEHRRIVVSTADLDLTSDAGVVMLNRRISRAITRVCGPVSARDLRAAAHRDQCARTASALASVNVDTAIAQARGKHALAGALVATSNSMVLASAKRQ